jgi:LPS sulfotransferase NodH
MSAASVDDVTRFVIVAAPRTGSNLLCTLLDQHPALLCHHEIFNPSGIFYALDLRDDALQLGSIEERDRDPWAFLERVYSTPLGRRGVGFKFTRGQDEALLDRLLATPGVRTIVLRRRNRVKTLVSDLVAQQTDQWEVYTESDLMENRPRVSVDLDLLEKHAEENAHFYTHVEAALSRADADWIATCYEQISSLDEQERLLRFLGVEPIAEPLQPRSVKQNPTDLRCSIANFEELAQSLRGTAYHAELLDCGL